VLRWRFSRFASPIAAFVLLLALTACMRGPMVAAPLGSPQSPFPGRGQPPGPPPPPPGATGPVKVAVLLPLSGANADLGKAMLEAAQLALFTTGNDRLTLVPRDTSGTPDGAVNAARAVIAEGAQLILGPLLAAEVDAVKPVAGEAKINVIAFSTATQLAGDNVFLMGFLPRQEVVREVSFARESGVSRFAALAPNTEYGRVMTDALREAAAQAGVAEVARPPAARDAAAVLRRAARGARALPSAAVLPFPCRLRVRLAPQPAARFARAMKRLRIASP